MAKTRFLGTLEVTQAKTDKEAVNLGQVKDLIKNIETKSSNINAAKGLIIGDGATTSFNVVHNLSLTDVDAYLIHVKDNNGNNITVDHVPTIGNEANSVTVTFAAAPLSSELFKIYIIGLE